MHETTDDATEGEDSGLDTDVVPVRRRRSLVREPKQSLSSPLLSGRSLEPLPVRRSWLRRNLRWIVIGIVVILVVVGAVVAKRLAESAADAEMDRRVAELTALLDGAVPADLMAFGANVDTPGSLAQRLRDTDGFVNVNATAELAFIRVQPGGWWSGFTERCVVAQVRDDAVAIDAPKTNCVRIEVPERP